MSSKEVQVVEAHAVIEGGELRKPEFEKFCRYYTEQGMSGTAAYGKAYGIDITSRLKYMSAAANASRLLKKDKIVARINQLLTLDGFSAENADKQLTYLMNQHEDKKVKLAALKEYNALTKRTGAKQVFSGNTFNLTQLLEQAEG